MPSPKELLQTLLAEGRAHLEQGRGEMARNTFAAAVACAPASPEAHARLAEACARLADWPSAVRVWRLVLKLRPGLAAAHTGLALALHQLGEYAAATAEFRQAAAANPTVAETHFNLGTNLLAGGRPADAITAFRAALQVQAAYPEARFNLALALLKAGHFKTGALAYESRWQAEWRGKERPFAGRRWSGRALPAGPLLLWGEQGIGDEIMFAGLLPTAAVAAQTACLVECAPRLVPLFARSFPTIQVFPRTNPPAPELRDDLVHAPLGALPSLLWPVDRPPAAPPAFLRPDPDVVARMRARLAAFGPGRKIGIAWRGGHPAAAQPRLIPPPAWQPLLARADVVAISLQHGPPPGEMEALARTTGATLHVLDDVDPLQDMDTFGALLAALDAVVSVDNSTVHLAGALGVPTAVLLAVEADWRWGIDGVPCPWYRSVMRLRQQTPADWITPMQAAVDFLALLPGRP